jgi:predicted FMN-binding regulatory protein PaiB
MSQNRDLQDQAGVVEGLRKRANDDDLEIAKIVSRQLKPTG